MPQLDKDQYSKAEVEELIRENEEAQAEALEVATKVAELSDAEREIYKSLEGEAQHDFLHATPEQRAAEVAKQNDSNPVVYKAKNGTEFRKNDDPRLVQMAKERDEERADFLKMQAEREQERYEKRADEELPNLPGEVQTRAAILKAVDGIEDEATREEAIKALKAQNTRMGEALREVGTAGIRKQDDVNQGTGAKNAHEELEKRAREYVKEHPETSFYEAYDIVSGADPELAKRAVQEG